jgi:uncharacterized protein
MGAMKTVRPLFAACWLALLAWALPFPARAAVEVPPSTGYVTDTAGVLGSDAARIADEIADLERRTSFEIGVLTVATLDGEEPAAFAQRVYDTWKIGKRGKDNGLLFLVAVRDRKLWIATGYGTEKIIPDGKAGEIRDTILRPAFREGRYGDGLLQAVEAVRAIVLAAAGQGEPIAVAAPREWPLPLPWIGVGVFGLVILVAVLGALFGRRRAGARPRGRFRDDFDPLDTPLVFLPPPSDPGGSFGGSGDSWSGGGSDSSSGGSSDSGGSDFGGGDSGGGGAGGDY